MTAPASSSEPPPRWPAWYGIAALLMAIVIAAMAGAVLFVIVKAADGKVDSNSPGINVSATLIQDVVLVGCALWLASKTRRPTPWQFGLRATPFLRALKWAAIAFAIYFGFQILYILAVHPHEKQSTLQDLGAGSGALATLAIGILVVGVAPVAEEFFFRGFFYGALRSSMSFLPAALIDGFVFGIIHAPTGIEAVPPLVALGFAFCLAYEATGSILPGIVLHALNNMVAFGSDKQGSWAVGAVVAGAVLTACVAGPALLPRARTAPG